MEKNPVRRITVSSANLMNTVHGFLRGETPVLNEKGLELVAEYTRQTGPITKEAVEHKKAGRAEEAKASFDAVAKIGYDLFVEKVRDGSWRQYVKDRNPEIKSVIQVYFEFANNYRTDGTFLTMQEVNPVESLHYVPEELHDNCWKAMYDLELEDNKADLAPLLERGTAVLSTNKRLISGSIDFAKAMDKKKQTRRYAWGLYEADDKKVLIVSVHLSGYASKVFLSTTIDEKSKAAFIAGYELVQKELSFVLAEAETLSTMWGAHLTVLAGDFNQCFRNNDRCENFGVKSHSELLREAGYLEDNTQTDNTVGKERNGILDRIAVKANGASRLLKIETSVPKAHADLSDHQFPQAIIEFV